VPQRKYPDAALANLDRPFMVNMPQRGCIEPMALGFGCRRGATAARVQEYGRLKAAR
jgi:hypothetical protein